MAIEQAKIGEVATQMMEALDHNDYGENAKIRDIMHRVRQKTASFTK